MAEKIAENVPTANGSSIVLKSNSFSNNLMLSTGLDLTFLDPTGSTELKRVTLKPEEIGFESSGFSAPLPAEINNELAQKVNSYGGKFKVKALEYDPVGSKAVGDPAYFDASVTGTLKVLQDYVKKEGESINAATFTEKKETAFADDKATADEIKSSDETLNAAAAESASTATEATAVKTSNKGKILAIIAAIILLLFILGLLALFLAGFFGGSKDNSANVNETTPQEQTEEATKDDTSDNSTADDNTETEDSSATDDNAANSETQDNTPAKETAPAATDSSSSSTVCVITSDPDNVMIKNCIASKPDSATVTAFAKDAFSKDKCDLGKRLFSSYGRKDGSVAYTYGQYFDPNSQESTSCASKDKTQAVYWYEKAVELGNDNAKSALSALKN
mgnify:FL=1